MEEIINKTVMVEVTFANQRKTSYELTFNSVDGKGDVETLESKLKLKSKEILDFIKDDGVCDFLQESVIFRGRWNTVGENSPIKHLSFLKCEIGKRRKLDFPSRILPDNEDSANFYFPSIILPDTEDPSKLKITCNGETVPLVNPNTEVEKEQEFISTDEEIDEHRGQTFNDSNTSSSPTPSTSKEVEKIPNSSALNREYAAYPKKKQSEKLDFKKWKMPSGFGTTINKQLQCGKALTNDQLSFICRRVANSIEEVSLCPCPESLRAVVNKLFAKFPSTMVDPNDEVSSSKVILGKIQRILHRLRCSSGNQLSVNGGRPVVAKAISYLDPGVHSQDASISENEVDMVSYEENVNKLLAMNRTSSGSPAAIKSLFKLTFKGRRFQITSGMLLSVKDILRSHCPVINQPIYLCAELDLIFGQDTCKNLKEKWCKVVPVVLAIAQKSKLPSITKILNNYHSLGDNEAAESTFERKSCAVLELLPILTSTPSKGGKARKFFFDAREDSANLIESIKSPLRTTPFILKIGETSFTIVVDKQPYMESQSSVDALIHLISVYYTFDIKWCLQVLPTLRFLRTEVMELQDDVTSQSKPLNVFYGLYKEMWDSVFGMDDDIDT